MAGEGISVSKHIIYISDLSVGGADSSEQAVPRSGYSNIAIELCRRLAAYGHDIKILGLGYTGQEHWDKFSIVPCQNLQDVGGYMNNLKIMRGIDVVICALDINHFQEQIFPVAKKLGLKYIRITPLESDPLCITWANLLNQMDKVFFISRFGAEEAKKVGVDAEHIDIGIDTVGWRLRTEEEYRKVRESLGYDTNDFVILTVADNQERKNLGAGLQAAALLKEKGVSVKYVFVTREHSQVGWKLYDLAYELGLSSDVRVFQSGMPFADLYAIYCAVDAFMLPSKGEGLGLPVMEAMSVGVPVVATRTGAIPELLENNRGWVVDWKCWAYDPFGNQRRYFINEVAAASHLLEIAKDKDVVLTKLAAARAFMETKNWDTPAKQIEAAMEKM